jgi:acetyl/propionyl-CoA carboxylase alpha subunit
MSLITRLLIANRGEIACRIMSTCREMGIGTVAVYADPDAEAPFVREADLAVALRGNSSAETYLDVEKVIAAAKRTNCDAIHPGYGFLSENAAFARMVIDAGLTWVGPKPDVIAAMGDKLEAKKRMVAAGVPTLPGIEVFGGANEELANRAREVGYPLLVKAARGGGGRGMRIVPGEPELAEAIAAARREAASAFGNDTVFLERYLEAARHIEVQIFGDHLGNVAHCFERECSIQRRHQKIIEEAPSSAVDPDLRARMGATAVAAGQAIGYDNAGTIEFMLASDGQFYFLEVNTRLQVEHPVTEAITGLDLVREQIRVAEGKPLSFGSDTLRVQGHAIEARLYAEDPAQGFLPATGRLVRFEPDAAVPVRVDSGVATGSDVSIHFDPMLAKVIAHAPTRTEAALKLASALERMRIHGVMTNRDFLVNVLRSAPFLEGDTTTRFIEVHQPARTRAVSVEALRTALVATGLVAQARNRAGAKSLRAIPSGWRNNPSQMQELRFRHDGNEVPIRYVRQRDGSFAFEAGEHRGSAQLLALEGDRATIELDGVRELVTVVRLGREAWVQGAAGEVHLVEIPRFPEAEVEAIAGGHTAPMPGKIVAIHVKPGDRVTNGQLVIILEAMKMEHRILAAADGTVREVRAHVGGQVEAGQLLLVVEDEGEEAS